MERDLILCRPCRTGEHDRDGWLNLVERFFGEITRNCIREGSISSVAELEKADDEFIRARNAVPSHSSGTRRGKTSWPSSTGPGKSSAYQNWTQHRLRHAQRNGRKVKLFVNHRYYRSLNIFP